jgi:DnaJ homologue, subfamily C, member 28, conserved domain
MSFKHIDIESALRRLADRRIEDAMKEGKFDNLRGAGKPLELEPMPAEEEARLMWWALRILRSNEVVPDEVRWRKTIDTLKSELSQTRSNTRVKILVTQINTLVYRVNTLGTNALKSAVTGVDMESELARLRERQDESASARR